MMGNEGETRILKKNTETDEWKYGDKISGFDEDIKTSQKLSETEILVMGVGVETRILNVEREKSLEALKKKLDQIISKKD